MLLSVGATSSLVAQHGMTQSAPWLFSKTSSPAPPFLRQNSSVSSGESVILVANWNRSFVFWPVQRSGLPDFIFRPLINSQINKWPYNLLDCSLRMYCGLSMPLRCLQGHFSTRTPRRCSTSRRRKPSSGQSAMCSTVSPNPKTLWTPWDRARLRRDDVVVPRWDCMPMVPI